MSGPGTSLAQHNTIIWQYYSDYLSVNYIVFHLGFLARLVKVPRELLNTISNGEIMIVN